MPALQYSISGWPDADDAAGTLTGPRSLSQEVLQPVRGRGRFRKRHYIPMPRSSEPGMYALAVALAASHNLAVTARDESPIPEHRAEVEDDLDYDSWEFGEGIGRELMALSESALAKIWDTPEEDEAWKDL